MTSKHETGKSLSSKPARVSSEAAYDLLASYGFVRRFVKGNTVANVGREDIGYGSRLLAETAESVEGLTDSPEAVDLASAANHAPNINYQRVDLPALPYAEGHFDAVVALRLAESTKSMEGLVSEAKRVLRPDGSLVISALDKQANTNAGRETGGRWEKYVPEFRELLERHFRHVRLYHLGAVVGGFVFPASRGITGASVEIARLSSIDPVIGTEPPTTRYVIAVCNDVEDPGQEEQPYLLLDRDRRVFDECEERAEDVELLRDEIRRMQETEVQAFLTTLQAYESRAAKAVRGLIHVRNLVYGVKHGVKRRLFDSSRQGS